MAEKTINIGGRLHSTATGNVVSSANEIFDYTKNKNQEEINADTYSKEETYNKNELNNLITTPDVQHITVPTFGSLPASGSADTIYRVSNWDGGATPPAVDASKYSEYGWDGSRYVLLSVKSAVDEVFDVSVFNAESGVAKAYETLTAALGGVPANRKKGGMSIKFIQTTPATYNVVKTEGVTELPTGTLLDSTSSIASGTYTASQLTDFATLPTTSAVTYYVAVTEDETTTYTTWVITLASAESQEYVQYRLMSTDWSNVVSNWQGVDKEPVAGSKNLVESGGVGKAIIENISPVELRLDNFTREFDVINKPSEILLPGFVFEAGKTYKINTRGNGSYVVQLYGNGEIITNFNTNQSAINRTISPIEDITDIYFLVGQGNTTTFKVIITTDNLSRRVSNKVDFSEEQELTDTQKSTARNNINAANNADVEILNEKLTSIESEIYDYVTPDGISYTKGYLNQNSGNTINYKNALRSGSIELNAGSYISLDTSIIDNLIFEVFFYNIETGSFIRRTDWGTQQINIDKDCKVRILVSDTEHYLSFSYTLPDLSYAQYVIIKTKQSKLDTIIEEIDSISKSESVFDGRTKLVSAQKYVAEDWHLPFIDMTNLGLGANHIIPGTAKIWNASGTTDLVQKNVWMADGTHPYGNGTEGVNKMYARTAANQLALISPSYKVNDENDGVPSYWKDKVFAWLGTSIPAGSDETLDIEGPTDYPRLVALQLGATRKNLARGSSMVRINAANGNFSGIPKSHFLRAATRMIAEADYLATPEVWATIYAKQSSYGAAPSESDTSVMKGASWESFLKPYLDGTQPTPDLFVIDHGHNDTANNNDGVRDWEVMPTQESIDNGVLVEDTYMTDNNYANLKLALNNDLSGIEDLRTFAVSLNRNCFIGAMNFLITVILSYKPYARIAIVGDYN